MVTSYFLNCVMGNVFHSNTDPAIPTTYYIGLSSTNPATHVAEPSGGSYSRVAISGFSSPVNGVVSNANAITFDKSTGNWGTMTHFVVYDAQSGGNLLMYDAMPNSRTIETDTIAMFQSGSLQLTLSSAE